MTCALNLGACWQAVVNRNPSVKMISVSPSGYWPEKPFVAGTRWSPGWDKLRKLSRFQGAGSGSNATWMKEDTKGYGRQPCGGRAQPLVSKAGDGSAHNCGRGGSACPEGSTCDVDPADRWAVCCPDGRAIYINHMFW